jgi:hypothetical protein
LKEQPPLAPVLARLVEFRPPPAVDDQAESAAQDYGAWAPNAAAPSGVDDPTA